MTTPENPVTPEQETAESAGAPSDASAEQVAADASVPAEPAPEQSGDAPAEAAGSDRESELTADLQRVSAEYANYRKRTARDVADAGANAKAAVVRELLVVVDDLDRARSHGDLEAGPLKSVADKIDGVLGKLGLEPFGVEGDAFDPEIHEAVQHEGTGSAPVLGTVLRQGYRIDGKVIRNAMVAVVDGQQDEN